MLDREKIKRARESQKPPMSMAKAAIAAGMGSAQAWNKIENGDGVSLSVKTLNKVAKALGVKAKDLLK
jgi:transcriptional regulator with XRE-family HTH domain